MKSVLLHKYEKQFDYVLCVSILSLLLIELIDGSGIVNEGLKHAIWGFCYALCMSLLLHIHFRFKNWKKEGFHLSKQIGLKRLVIFRTVLVNQQGEHIYELHHMPNPFFQGLYLRKQSKGNVMEQINNDLKNDFMHLGHWAKNHNAAFISVTHKNMASLWRKNANSIFFIEDTVQVEDPYVKPSYIRWVVMSFATTGRIVPLPEEWGTILFLKK
ncbi:MAG TPA: hypothetical protein VNM69_03790 [Bacillus sp. (in: firmicutes)]|nr:hypothetical protein [Bacillus sp. (in: firmicutes)]